MCLIRSGVFGKMKNAVIAERKGLSSNIAALWSGRAILAASAANVGRCGIVAGGLTRPPNRLVTGSRCLAKFPQLRPDVLNIAKYYLSKVAFNRATFLFFGLFY